VPARDKYLSDQLDSLRDGARNSDPDSNLKLFHSFLSSLPPEASGTIRYRAKANIGLQHLARGEGQEAARWLLEAYDEAPSDPRAVANRALALWVRGDPEDAYRFAIEQLALDPTNDTLASYLPQIAVTVPSVTDGLDGVPEALRETEPVVLGQAIFLRGRDMVPAWWEWVRSSRDRFPDSKHLKLLAAFSDVDEIARDKEAQRTQVLSINQRERLIAAAAVLDESWQARPWLIKSAFDDTAAALASAMIAYRLLHDRQEALARAERIAVEALTNPSILHNAVMVALSFGEDKLALRLIALSPNDPDLTFHAGVVTLSTGAWKEAADLFRKSNIPEVEKRVTETAIALAPIVDAGRPANGSSANPTQLEALISTTSDSPRGLILIAQVATMLGLEEVAQHALRACRPGLHRPRLHAPSF
jgi:hypothetical protein